MRQLNRVYRDHISEAEGAQASACGLCCFLTCLYEVLSVLWIQQ
jgi:hypothetical protein